MRKMTAFANTIPNFMRRPLERSPVRLEIKSPSGDRAAPVPPQPRQVIHGGLPPLQPNFLTPGAAETFDPRPAPGALEDDSPPNPSTIDGGVVDLTARRGAVSSAKSASRLMSRALHAAFEAEPGDSGDDDDAAFQVTLPRSVIRQIRLFAAEQGTTHRAVVLRALRSAGLNIPEGADVDRRVVAAKRRHQA
jgi:hypothetical protein